MKEPGSLSTTYRRRREQLWVAFVFLLVIVFGFLEGWFFEQESDLPLSGNILLFALINLNVILLLLLIYLVLRNIVKLIFERKRGILGHKLKTRLILAFVGVSLIPTIPLFWVATQFIFSSLDYWFSHSVEESLEQSVALAKDYLDQETADLLSDCRIVQIELSRHAGFPDSHALVPSDFKDQSASLLEQFHMDGMFFFGSDGAQQWEIYSDRLSPADMKQLREKYFKEAEGNYSQVRTIPFENKREALMADISFVPSDLPFLSSGGKLIVVKVLPPRITKRLSAITSGYEAYLQLKLLHSPLKTSHFITFSIVALLVLFAAIWFGFFLARNITVPVQALASATRKVAEGDLDVELSSERSDELGMLMASFNRMVHDLRENRKQLADAYSALQQSHLELEERRRYMEIVLSNVGAGVVSADAQGRIITMNKSAETLFGYSSEDVKGRLYSELLQRDHMDVVESFIQAFRSTGYQNLEQRAQVIIGNQPAVLLIKASMLRDEQGQFMGVVVVLDDLTELEKAQRMAAWREVARRIAHEVKNPLTPIQLSAQRLRRKYSNLVESQGSLLDECTTTIIQQVEHMKHLVNEFSRFARLPRAQLAPCNLAELVAESLGLFRHGYPHVTFTLEEVEELPLLRLDRDQFKQVMINLLENALHALENEAGEITVRLFYDSALKIARIECADTGHGLSAEDKLRIFEPYYSRKEKGTGLGLAIVASIIADHNGFIRVLDNVPKGTIIVIELPG